MSTLAVNPTGMAQLREQHGLETDGQLAEAIGLHKGTVSRVLAGKSAPGPRFIANTLENFPLAFETVFDVVPESQP